MPGHDPIDRDVLARVLGSRDTRVHRGAVTCPVLCVSGGADRNVANWISRRIARRYRAEHQHHPRLPHWIVAASALDEVAPGVLRWLDATLERPAQPRKVGFSR
jgi:alpha-beta hydrolase superfamily lysophospholipase